MLTLRSQGNNAVSRIALVPPEFLASVRSQVTMLLARYDIASIYILEGEHIAAPNNVNTYVPSKGSIAEASNGELLAGQEITGFKEWRELLATTELLVPKDGTYIIRLRVAPVTPWQLSKVDIDGTEVSLNFYSTAVDEMSMEDRMRNLHHVFVGPISLKQGTHTLNFYARMGVFLDQILVYPYHQEPSQSYQWKEDFNDLTNWGAEYIYIHGNEERGKSYDFSADGRLNLWMNVPTTPYEWSSESISYMSLSYNKELNIDTSSNPYFEARLKASPNTFTLSFIFYDKAGNEIGQLGAEPKDMQTVTWNLRRIFGDQKISSMKIMHMYIPVTHPPSGLDRETVSASIDYIGFSEDTDKKSTYLLHSEGASPEVTSYERESPTLVKVDVKADSPFLLTFLDSYHSSWQANVDSNEIKPIVVWGYANAFLIEPQPNIPVTLRLEYGVQKYFYIGAIITILSILGSISGLVISWKRGRK